MWDLASQRPLKTVLFSWFPSCVYNYCGWWLHAFKLATVQYLSRPKIVAELKRQLAGPSWLRMCCKKPRREQFLETLSASSATWIKTLAYGGLRQWGWWPRPGYSQSFQTWQRSIDGWINRLGLCTQLWAHCHHWSTPWRKSTPIEPLSPCHSSKSHSHMYFSMLFNKITGQLLASSRTVWKKRAMERGDLTMAPTCKKGHPVDGNGHSTMLVVEMVDVVCGTKGGGNSGSHSRAGEHQQRQREHQPKQKGRTGPHHRWRSGWLRYQKQPSIHLHFHLLHWGRAWDKEKAPPPHTTQTGSEHLKWIQCPWSPAFQPGEEKIM